MKMTTLVVFSLFMIAICVKAQNVSTSIDMDNSLTSVSSSFRFIPVSTTSTHTPSSESTPVEALSIPSSPSTSPVSASAGNISQPVSEEPISSASKSILASEYISTATNQYQSSVISKTDQLSTYNDSTWNSITASINVTTTSIPLSNITGVSLSTMLKRSTVTMSYVDVAVEYTSRTVGTTNVSGFYFTESASVVSNTSAPLISTSDISEITFTKSSDFITTTGTTLMSNSLESLTSTMQIHVSSSRVIDQDTNLNHSSDILVSHPSDKPSITIFASIPEAIETNLNTTSSSTSLITNYFTESVYANISSSPISDRVLKTSIMSIDGSSSNISPSKSVTSEIANTFSTTNESLLTATLPVESNVPITFSPTQVSYFPAIEPTTSYTDHLQTSIIDSIASPTSVSPSSENSVYPSSYLETEAITRSWSSKMSPNVESYISTSSTPVPSSVLPQMNITIIQVQSSMPAITSSADVSSQTVNTSTFVFTTTTTAAAATSTPDIVFSTNKDVTTSIPTTTGNFTVSVSRKTHKIYRVLFTFEGDCEILSESAVLQMEFWKALMDIIKSTTKLKTYNLDAEQMLCEPLRVFLRIQLFNKSSDVNVSEVFESINSKIASSHFFVPIITDDMHVLNFTASNFEIVEIISSDKNDLEVAKSGLEVVDIVIISIASFLFAVLVLMMIIVMCRECYVRKRTTTFHLSDVPHVNLKLSDFTLTRIPRPQMFYRDNSLRKPGPVPVSKLRTAQNGRSDAKSNDKMEVNRDHIRVRMRSHDDGLVVGITCSNPPSPNKDSSSSSGSPVNGDQAKKFLIKEGTKDVSEGVANPNYSADEELSGNTKLVIEDDENEQLL